MCSANAQGRSPEGAIEWGRKGKEREREGGEADRGRESERRGGGESWRMGKEGKGGKERQRGGEGGSSQAALYPDRSPLHTNFLVKEEKMALNPEKSFSPGAGLSAEGWVDTSRAFLLRLAPSGTQQLGYRSQQSSLSIAIINTPSEYNEPYHDTWISVGAVDSSHLTARWKSNVKGIDFLIMSSPSQMANKSRTNISCSVAVYKHSPWQNAKPPSLRSQLLAKTIKNPTRPHVSPQHIYRRICNSPKCISSDLKKGEKKSLFYFKSGVLAVQSGCSHLPRLLFAGCVSRLLFRNLGNNSDAIDKEWQFILRLSTGQEKNDWSIKFRGMNLFCIWFFH